MLPIVLQNWRTIVDFRTASRQNYFPLGCMSFQFKLVRQTVRKETYLNIGNKVVTENIQTDKKEYFIIHYAKFRKHIRLLLLHEQCFYIKPTFVLKMFIRYDMWFSRY